MSTAQPGTVMVDRYRLTQPAATDLAAADAWEAHDQILDRPVRVTFVGGPQASATLDAARRAALVSDPRLTRVLDVGTTDLGAGSQHYIISEPYRGSSLTEVVSRGLVDAQQARAVVGEAAAALEAAAQRGVHHLALRPEAVRVDGHRVVVTGLGIDAALADRDAGATPSGGDAAAAADARNLVALVYYALTARWAGDSLEEPWVASDTVRPLPAQEDESGIVPVSALVPHVDEGLDVLVRRTFTEGSPDAPTGPQDVVAALAPWGEVSVVDALPQFVQPTTTEPPVRSSVLGAGAGGATLPGTPPPAPPVRRPATGRIARGGVAGAAGAAGAAAGAAGATQAMPPAQPQPPADPAATAALPPQQPGQPAQPPAGPPPATDQPTQAFGAAAYGAGAGAGYAAAQPSAAQPAAAQPTAAQTPVPPQGGTAHAPVPPPPPGAGGPPDGRPTTGGFASSPAPRRRGVNPTPIVMALVVVLVVAGALWAGSRAFNPFEPPISPSSSPPSAAAEGDGGNGGGGNGQGDEESPEETEEPQARPQIQTGDQLDPEGVAAGDHEGEHPEAVDLAYDADPSTFWYTRQYTTPDFGNLKAGIGYVIELEKGAPVSEIELATNSSGGHVEVRATDSSSPTDGEVLAEGSFDSTTTLELSDETVADSFVLWITELPVTNGKNYLELNEIVIS